MSSGIRKRFCRKKEHPAFQVGHHLSKPQSAIINITLYDPDGNPWHHQNILEQKHWTGAYVDGEQTPPIEVIKKLIITNTGEETVTLLVDDIGFRKDVEQR